MARIFFCAKTPSRPITYNDTYTLPENTRTQENLLVTIEFLGQDNCVFPRRVGYLDALICWFDSFPLTRQEDGFEVVRFEVQLSLKTLAGLQSKKVGDNVITL